MTEFVMEWLILLLLTPAILVPIVLLCGFAGCDLVFTVKPDTVTPPVAFEAKAIDVSAIRLSWTSQEPAATFEIERTKEGAAPEMPRDVGTVSLIEDSDLEVGTKYFYRVRAVRTSDGETSEWVGDENSSATTFIFNGKLDPALGAGTDQANLHGFCFVTRIPAMTPQPNAKFWPKMSITLRGSTAGALTIDEVSISLPADINTSLPPDQRERWDSHTDLMVVANGVQLAAGSQALIVNYPLDGSQDLLVAFDLNPTAGQGNGRFGPLILTPPPRSHFKAATAEAGIQNRASDFQPSTAHYLVDRIEVA